MSFNYTSMSTTTTVVPATTPEPLCEVRGYTYFDIKTSDIFLCFMRELPFILYDANFAYIAAGLSLIIILTSLFGRTKLHYCLFILNMALIDLITSYDVACMEPHEISIILESSNHNCPAYQWLPFRSLYFVEIITHLPPIGVLLLAFSRFISVFFSKFYKKVAKTWKIILSIIITNLLYIALIIALYLKREQLTTDIYNENKVLQGTQSGKISWLKKAANVKFVWLIIYCSIPAIALLLSIIFFAFFVVKLFSQLKFQAKSNVEMFKTNLRIITVLSIQTIMLCALLPLEAMYQLDQPVSAEFAPYYPHISYSPWLYSIISSENRIRCFREFRVFIDSIIILAFMKGYREDLVAAVLWFFKIFKKIWNFCKCANTSVKSF